MANKRNKVTKKVRFTKARFIIFAVIVVVLAASLPFSWFFEAKLDSVLRKNYGEFDQATKQECVFHMIDVGNGDCLALELPDGKKMLVDCGMDIKSKKQDYQKNAVDYLTQVVFDGETNSENRVFDYMILTHPHDDHFKMSKAIFQNFKILNVYRPAVFYYNENYAQITQDELELAINSGFVPNTATNLKNEDVATNSNYNYKTFLDCVKNEGSNVFFTYDSHEQITITSLMPAYEIKFYWPVELNLGESDYNIYSPIMIFSYNNHSICLTGDSVLKSEKFVAQHYDLPQVDLLKVGHHGSAGASDSTFLNEIKPTYAFISCSSDNSYGHPNEKALSRIKEAGTQNILTTMESGNLVFAITNDQKIMIAASSGVVFAKVKWWYVCGGVLLVAAIIIFCTPKTAKKVLKNTEVKKIVKK